MKHNYIIAIFISIVVAITACQQSEVPSPPEPNHAINIAASIHHDATRVAQPSDNYYEFEPGDSIQVVGWTGDFQSCPEPWTDPSQGWWINSLNVFNGRKWIATPYMRWQNGQGLMHNFVSWWPVGIALPNVHDLRAVSHVASATYSPDILLASTSLERPANNTVNLNFHHLLSRFDVHLHFTEHYGQIDNISLSADVVLNAHLNLIEGNVTCGNTAGTMPLHEMVPQNEARWSGTQIIIPQTLANAGIDIYFTENGTPRHLTYAHPTLRFQSGRRTKLTLLVSKDEIKPIEVSVGEWTDSPSLGDADAEEILP
jgi:hypothetical protein